MSTTSPVSSRTTWKRCREMRTGGSCTPCLLDLAEFHHGDLDDSVVPLVAETLDALEPIASPSAATIGDLARRWETVIASALRELEKAGVARPTEPSWVASLRELGIRPKMDGFRHSYVASTGDRASDD